MAEERFLITGAQGCIGAWVVYNLVRNGTKIVAFNRSQNRHRLELLLSQDEIDGIDFVQGDITDLESIVNAVIDYGITNIIHLAALQLPFCKANPPLGAAVNVVGTVNIFEAAKKASIKRVVYASSTAVYGSAEEYPERALAHNALLKPNSHYGVYKQANEGNAKVYWINDGIESIGLRPYVVYGAGRDQGMTSKPTLAMLAAAAGKPYHIAFGGGFCFQYGDDVAKIFIHSTRVPFSGAEVFNIGGGFTRMEIIVKTIEEIEPSVAGKISFEDKPLPFPENVDSTPLSDLLGPLPETTLEHGVSETIKIFKQALTDGRLSAEDL